MISRCFRFLLPACLLAAATWNLPAQQDEPCYWVLDRTETTQSEQIPYFTLSAGSIRYNRTHTGYKTIREESGFTHSERAREEVTMLSSWTAPPQRILFGEEESVRIDYTFTSSPKYENTDGDPSIELSVMGIPKPWHIFVTMSAKKGVERSQSIFEPIWKFGSFTTTPCITTHASGTFTPTGDFNQYNLDRYLPDGSWTLTIEVINELDSDDRFGTSGGFASAHYLEYFTTTTRYIYRFEGTLYQTIENTIDTPPVQPGEDDGTPFPWEILLIPRIESAAAKGAKLDYTKLMAKIRVLEGLGNPPPKGVLTITLEEARLVLQNQFGSTLESVVEECAQAVRDVNTVL